MPTDPGFPLAPCTDPDCTVRYHFPVPDLSESLAKLQKIVDDMPNVRPLDALIGRLDRLLSEFLIAAADAELDEADRQTLKHHADDLIGVGNAALKKLGWSPEDPA